MVTLTVETWLTQNVEVGPGQTGVKTIIQILLKTTYNVLSTSLTILSALGFF